MSQLTDAQFDQAAAYVKTVRHELYLDHWEIRVDHGLPEDGEAIASIDPCAGRYVATIRFGESFWAEAPTEQRHTVTHELLHLAHFMVSDAVRLGEYKRELGQTTYEHLYDQVRRGFEYMVDALTTIVAPHMPLPDRKETSDAAQEGTQREDGQQEHPDADQGGPAAQAGGRDRAECETSERQEGQALDVARLTSAGTSASTWAGA